MTTQRIGMGLLLVAVMLLSTVEARNLHNNWPDLKDGEQGEKVAAVWEKFVQPALEKYKQWSTDKQLPEGDDKPQVEEKPDDKPQVEEKPEVEDKPDNEPQPPPDGDNNKPWQGWKQSIKDFMGKARSHIYPGQGSGSGGSPSHPGHGDGEHQQPGGSDDSDEPQQPSGGDGSEKPQQPGGGDDSDAPQQPGGGNEPEQPDAADDSDAPAGGDGVSDSVLKGVLDLHNKYRARHGVPALSWSSSIASTAQSYSRGCVMVHSRNPYGENLGRGYRSFDAAVRAWYSEESGYSYNGGSGAGHFTQMVWKSTTQLGCGYSSCGGSPLYVCNYSPPGNYGGRYRENVPLPRS